METMRELDKLEQEKILHEMSDAMVQAKDAMQYGSNVPCVVLLASLSDADGPAVHVASDMEQDGVRELIQFALAAVVPDVVPDIASVN